MKRRRLGQHYLTDPEVVRRILEAADISPGERVLEIGTGRGVLTKELARAGSSFEGYEIDRGNYGATLEALGGSCPGLHFGDAFKGGPRFEVLVSSLPYSESATFVEWLAGMAYDRALVLLQEDFVGKIRAPPGSRDYRAVSVISQLSTESETLSKVRRSAFSPPPRVSSVLVRFRPRSEVGKEEALRIKKLFSLRRREVRSALAELGMRGPGFGRRRVYSLTPLEVRDLCSA
ncbi:MAG: hypothetical protein HY247_06350 [archaeon]|nr:MAG: hypothetical protein HY247_06350 [archaeon]